MSNMLFCKVEDKLPAPSGSRAPRGVMAGKITDDREQNGRGTNQTRNAYEMYPRLSLLTRKARESSQKSARTRRRDRAFSSVRTVPRIRIWTIKQGLRPGGPRVTRGNIQKSTRILPSYSRKTGKHWSLTPADLFLATLEMRGIP